METNNRARHNIKVEFSLCVRDLTDPDGPFLVAEDIAEQVDYLIYKLKPNVEQARAIFAFLRAQLYDLEINADCVFSEAE